MRSLALVVALFIPLVFSGSALAAECSRHGTSLQDVHWKLAHPMHPLVGRVFKGDLPVVTNSESCARTPLQQLIVEVWGTIREGGVVLLGEVHDNPEHHKVRADIMWPRLEPMLTTRNLRPAAVFEHIRTSQQPQLDSFYDHAARSRRWWGAADLLKGLGWKDSGWPSAQTFYPLFDAILRAKLPIYPGNAVRERMRALARDPSDADAHEAARLSLAQAMPQPLLEALTAELGGSHCGMLPGTAFGAMSLAQRYTDAYLADALVKAAGRHNGAFLLAGNGHVRTDRGVPWYVRQLAPARKVVSVALLEAEPGNNDASTYFPRSPDGKIAADYILFTSRHPRQDPCQTMRQRKG